MMKTLEEPLLREDAVIREVRRAKTALAQRYGFDVAAMVRGLRDKDDEERSVRLAEERLSEPTPPPPGA